MLEIEREIFDGCDAVVANALREWAASLTPRHSLTSREFSVVRGLRLTVDPEVTRVFHEFIDAVPCLERMLSFKLSEVWSSTPNGRRDKLAGETDFELAAKRSHLWGTWLRQVAKEIDRHLQGLAQLSALWDRAEAAGGTRGEPPRDVLTYKSRKKDFPRLWGTLDTVVSLIGIPFELRPQRSKSLDSSAAERQIGPYSEYCVLCWRKTERWNAKEQVLRTGERQDARSVAAAGETPKGRPSGSYCTAHHPVTNPSAYRRDWNTKEAFAAEVRFLSSRRFLGKFSFSFHPDPTFSPTFHRLVIEPVSACEEDVRRAAYAKVHSGLRGSPEQVLYLRRRGQSTAEIAATLGKPLRTVQHTLKKAGDKVEQAARVAFSMG
jgi:hypothetical protein